MTGAANRQAAQREATVRRVARRADLRPTAQRSATIHRFMVRIFDRFFRRHMNALRLARWGWPDLPAGAGPVVILSNHPGWWDAAIYILAADRLLGSYESYAPIDRAMLDRYAVFGRIGGFGIDLESPRGAATFLSAASDILSQPSRALWITAQGRFSDVRERPLALKAGVARVAEIAPGAVFLPLAIEYAFWQERGAETFLAFGEPIKGADLLALSREERRSRLETELTAVLDRLSADVASRDPDRFDVILGGKAGVGGVYDLWKRTVAALRGQRFDPAHEAAAKAEARGSPR